MPPQGRIQGDALGVMPLWRKGNSVNLIPAGVLENQDSLNPIWGGGQFDPPPL